MFDSCFPIDNLFLKCENKYKVFPVDQVLKMNNFIFHIKRDNIKLKKQTN